MKNKPTYPEFDDSVKIYEIVRVALSNNTIFNALMYEMDINESELERIFDKIMKTLGESILK